MPFIQEARENMNPIVCRKAVIEEVELIFRIDHLHRNEKILKATQHGECFVVEMGSQIIGFATMNYCFFDYGFVELMIIAEGYRHSGVGTALTAYLLHICSTEKLFTSTNESNYPMRAFLAKNGFRACGQIDALDEGDPELFFIKKAEKMARI